MIPFHARAARHEDALERRRLSENPADEASDKDVAFKHQNYEVQSPHHEGVGARLWEASHVH